MLGMYKAAEDVLKREVPQLEGLGDALSLEAHLRNMNVKNQVGLGHFFALPDAASAVSMIIGLSCALGTLKMSAEEIKRLTATEDGRFLSGLTGSPRTRT